MKKEINNAEQKLLSNVSIDELIKMKMEEEMKIEIEKSKQIKTAKVEKEISKVPKDFIFSKNSIYRVFNRDSKTETFVNGIQAEAFLGMQNDIREKIKSGQMDAFSTETAYVKFEYAEI